MKEKTIIYPNIIGMLSGVSYATQDKNGLITLHYTDGEKESRISDKSIDSFENLFSIVGFVQESRIM